MKCKHYDDCGNIAMYELEDLDGNVFHVCDDCDMTYTNCSVCGYSGRLDVDMSIRWGTDNFPTCLRCQAKEGVA